MRGKRGEGAALGEPRRAIEYGEQARALRHAIGDRQGEANTCWNLGLQLEVQGDLLRAVELMRVRVDFLRDIGHPDTEKAAARVNGINLRLDDN